MKRYLLFLLGALVSILILIRSLNPSGDHCIKLVIEKQSMLYRESEQAQQSQIVMDLPAGNVLYICEEK